MTNEAVIQGSLVDVRNVNTHKCARMIVDVPSEDVLKVVAAFGWPTMANPVPVAVARLEPSALRQQLKESVEIERKKEPREWSTLKRSQQAGIACSDPGFWNFMSRVTGRAASSAEDAATCVRQFCGVNTRADFDTYPDKGERWDHLYSEYQLERRGAIA